MYKWLVICTLATLLPTWDNIILDNDDSLSSEGIYPGDNSRTYNPSERDDDPGDSSEQKWQSPPAIIDITNTGSRNMKGTRVWLLTLEMRECGPVSACTAVVHDGILKSLQGIAFSFDWQVRVALFWRLSNGACPRVLKSTSTKKIALANILSLANNSKLCSVLHWQLWNPSKTPCIFPPKSLQNFYHWACAYTHSL